MKEKIKTFVHTLWTKPFLDKRYDTETLGQVYSNLYCYALSFAYLKRLGQRVEICADRVGLELLSFIPYDKTTELEAVPGNPRFWAQSKFLTYQEMQPGDIYLDGDVFIRSQKMLDVVDGLSDCDAFVQSIEVGSMIENENYGRIRKELCKTEWSDLCFSPSEIIPVCNTGVVCLKNQKLKEEYIKLYGDIMERCEESGIMKTLPGDLHLDVITEQQPIYELCTRGGYKLGTLFDTAIGPFLRENEQDYKHLISGRKYLMLPLVKNWLREVNPDLWTKIQEKYEGNEERIRDIISQI